MKTVEHRKNIEYRVQITIEKHKTYLSHKFHTLSRSVI